MAWNLFPTKRPTVSKTTLDLLLLFGLVSLFYANPLLNPATMSLGGDALSLFTPSVAHYARSMYLGELPFWNHHTWLGAPFLAAFQSGVLYPPQLLTLLFPNPALAVQFMAFFSLVWLSFGCYIFGLRALRLERFPSILMAICMACGGFVGGHMDHVNQLAAISWIPWILCEALLVLRNPRLKYVGLLAICLAMQTLAGHPQYTLYTMVYLLCLGSIYFVYYHHRRRAEDAPSWVGLVLLFVGVMLGLGLASAQILPAAELSDRSIRRIDHPERMFNYSFPPRNLITLVYPFAYGNPVTGLHYMNGERLADTERVLFLQDPWAVSLGARNPGMDSDLAMYNYDEWVCYVGLITVALALLAIITLFKEFVVRCFLFLALVMLVLAAGNYVSNPTPPYELMMRFLPGGDHMRVPARFLVYFNLSIVVLAAVGYNQVMHYLRMRQRVPRFTLTLLGLLLLILVFGDLYLFSTNQAFRYPGPTAIAEETGPVLDFFQENPGPYKVFRQLEEVPYNTDAKRLVEGLPRKTYNTRLQMQRFQPNLNLLHRIEVDKGYEEGLLPTMSYWNFERKFRRNLRAYRPDTELMGLLNIKYLATDKPYDPAIRSLVPLGRWLTPTWEQEKLLVGQDGAALHFTPLAEHLWPRSYHQFTALYQNRYFLPRFVPGEVLREYYDLSVLDVDTHRPDPERQPITPNMRYRRRLLAAPLFPSADFPVPQAKPLSVNAFEIEKPQGVGGEILMLGAAYPGWVCVHEKGTTPLRRVNAVMSAFHLPDGVTRAEVRFEPFSFRLGLFLSCMAVLVLGISVFFWSRPLASTLSMRKGK